MGSTLRDRLLVVERMTGQLPKELMNLVTLPESCRIAWEFFNELNSTRQSGFGINPITFTEILSLCHLRSIELMTWELDLIKKFDELYIEYNTENTSP